MAESPILSPRSFCCVADAPGGRRTFLTGLAALVATACAGPGHEGANRREAELLTQAQAALSARPVVDLHAHPGGMISSASRILALSALEDLQAGGVTTAFFAAVSDRPVIRREGNGIRQWREPEPGELRRITLEQIERVLARVREGRLGLFRGPADLPEARTGARPMALLALEGGDALEGDPHYVPVLAELGVRSIQLVHYRINELGDIQTERPRHGGLTTAGQGVVAEMNRLGLLVDGAHAAPDTLRGILATSRHPIIVSHTGPARLNAYSRHLSDALLHAVAARGGVVGIWPLGGGRSGIDFFLEEIAYVRGLIGADHVGIGTDMNGLPSTSVPSYRQLALVPAALLARGFAEADLPALFGGNVRRVLREVAGR